MNETRRSEFAIASLVIGICAFFNLFGLEKAIAAIVFGTIAINRITFSGQKGRGLAIAGIVLGSLAVLMVLFILIKFGPQLFQQAAQNQSS